MENNHENSFCKIILDLNLWHEYANRLKESYGLLEENDWISQISPTGDVKSGVSDYTSTIMMLKGMMLECLFKGVLVSQGSITCKDEELVVSKKYSKHNLVSMADDINTFNYTEKEKDVLERLGYYIVAGRLPRMKINTGKSKGYWSTGDNKVYKNILEKVEKIYSNARGASNKHMKTIIVDAVYCFVSENGQIFEEMHNLLETYPNRKIILTGANDEQFKIFGLDQMPYEVFTLKHNPEKTDPKYYELMSEHFRLSKDDVIYFEHNLKAVESARSVGIISYHYDTEKKDLGGLKKFLDENL
jgi:hypothetical protein